MNSDKLHYKWPLLLYVLFTCYFFTSNGQVAQATVERFTLSQTNYIIDYYNAINGDADPANDIRGEIVHYGR